MPKQRVILHCDMNCFYASCEMAYHPEWQEKPISYCTRSTGGTAYTVKYALENGLTVYNASSFDVGMLLNKKNIWE